MGALYPAANRRMASCMNDARKPPDAGQNAEKASMQSAVAFLIETQRLQMEQEQRDEGEKVEKKEEFPS